MYSKHQRFLGIKRNYSPEDVERLRGSLKIEYTLAKRGSKKLWDYLTRGGASYINALGALTGKESAVQMAKAGLKAIYLSGWQVAGDGNLAAQTYPDQSLYPSNSAPKLVERINNAFVRADQIAHMEESERHIDYFLPIVADCEAGFGGPLNAFELTKSMIAAGAAAVHFEDQLASEKKCGHMGGKVLVPTQQFIKVLNAARLAADVLDVPLVIVGRTDANAAALVTSDIDPYDRPFLTGQRTPEGFFRTRAGLDQAIARGLAYAPYCDVVWCETGKPNLEEARRFATAIHARYPGKPLAYNCSPSFNWKANLSDAEIAVFQRELGKMGYRFQFVTLAGFHSLNHAMFKLARDYRDNGMSAYTKIQEDEFRQSKNGFTAHKHQREVGTGYFDQVSMAISGGQSSTTALKGSTEEEQFTQKSFAISKL
ncbi:LOW QUALITY PROTEIN: isocitrate lyase [Acropora millepora]|uniref:LOW QUALITY PROTEIN: isocitrate lyase n=1 Tax=Acropora millepora TaxID=45264 RepID=UPI001CF0E460|nr:LOW QUALITY PROTEIN: isocitrate lyase [Acropora millepora]